MQKIETHTLVLREEGRKPLSNYAWEAEIRNGRLIELRWVDRSRLFVTQILGQSCWPEEKKKEYLRQLQEFIPKVLEEIERR